MTQQQQQKRRMTETEQRAHQVAGFVKGEINESEGRVLSRLTEFKAGLELKLDGIAESILDQVRKPERYTDRFLDWVKAKPASWLIWPILVFLGAMLVSLGRACPPAMG